MINTYEMCLPEDAVALRLARPPKVKSKRSERTTLKRGKSGVTVMAAAVGWLLVYGRAEVIN